jgi:hypothetical protein
MNDLPQSAISPLPVAVKLAAVSNLAEPALAKQLQADPRLVELIWAIQFWSMQPGGLDKRALDIIADFAPEFGPPIVHDESQPLTLAQRQQICESIECRTKEELLPFRSWAPDAQEDDVDQRGFIMGCGIYPARRGAAEEKKFNDLLMQLPRQKFRDVFLDAAKDNLAIYLRSLCVCESRKSEWLRASKGEELPPPPWYCENLPDVLFQAMELDAGRVENQLAPTKVVSLVSDCLDYAWQQKVPVKIEGDTRTGKTEAVKAWCSMNPGKCRLVSTPSGKSMGDLFKAIADAIGLPYGPNVRGTDLKDQIQYIIRHAGLFLIFDESHFLLPSSFDRNTQPARLDWIRTQIIDKKLPIALVTTPQAFSHSAKKFHEWTGYNFGQFFGRIMSNLTLPNELSAADLLEVTKIKGPDIDEKYHKFIVSRSMRSEGYLKTIEAICTRARHIAKRDNHPHITQGDVELAASEMIPSAGAIRPVQTPPEKHGVPTQGQSGTPQPPPTLECPARATAPQLATA